VGLAGRAPVPDDERVVQIEGDPDSPVSRGRLCPKGSATLQLTTGPGRERFVFYRRPYGTQWERLALDEAMDMVADRVIAARRATWQREDDGKRTARTMGIASLGGATLDNEENYLIKKLFTGLGVVQVENQARVCHSSTVVGLGTSFGRGGATTFMQDLQHADCIVIEGSNFAEAHPVGFQWVMEAKARGATVIHVGPGGPHRRGSGPCSGAGAAQPDRERHRRRRPGRRLRLYPVRHLLRRTTVGGRSRVHRPAAAGPARAERPRTQR
jgi:anaerobic selenocysteine-containing dehydrogenase